MLEGKIVIVTGARVILAARTLEADAGNTWGRDGPVIPGSLNETLDLIRAMGGQAEPYRIDLSSGAEIEKNGVTC